MAEFVAVLESAKDCDTARAWADKKSIKKLKVIALSLDALEYARGFPSLDAVHIWDILPMEDLIDRAFRESEEAGQMWVDSRKGRADHYLDISVHARLQIMGFFQHAAAALFVSEQLAEHFLKNQWTYISLARDNKKLWPENNLYVCISREYFGDRKIPVILIGREFFQIVPFFKFVGHIFFEIVHACVDRIRGKRPIKTILKGATECDVLISGWGRDISRSVDINVLAEQWGATMKKRLVAAIWRPGKMKHIPDSTDLFRNLKLRETIWRRVAYGPSLSLFSPIFWLPQLTFYNRVINRRFSRMKNFFPPSSLIAKLCSFKEFDTEFRTTSMFMFHEAFLAHTAVLQIFDVIKPNLFIGSDSGGASARAEILAAKQRNIFTMSTPHGYQAYGMPAYNYLADKILTHGPATEKILHLSGVQTERTDIIGTSHPRRVESRPIDPTHAHIVIGTRSIGGPWSNYSSRQNVYDVIMQRLLRGIAAQPNMLATVKSHPNGDYHAYYDLLVKNIDSPNIKHIPKGWTTAQFADACDILVCVGEMPSLYLSALYLKIPIVFIDGAMTKTQAKLYYDYQGLGSVVKTAEEAMLEIKKIATDTEYCASVMRKQNAFAKGYDIDQPEEKLLKIISAL